MERFLKVILITALLSGCASIEAYSEDERRIQKYQNHVGQIETYHQNPKDKLMIVIQSEPNNTDIDLHFSMVTSSVRGGAAGTTSKSLTTWTPFVLVFSLETEAEALRKNYKLLSSVEKKQIELIALAAAPVISFTAQNKRVSNKLHAEAYYNGKLISSDETDLPYGMVNLGFSVPLVESLKE